MASDYTLIRSEKAFVQFIKTYHKDRYGGRLPLFPITIKDLCLFLNHKSKTCQYKALQWLVCGLAKHPKHDERWKETVLRHRKVQALLEGYRSRDKQRAQKPERRVSTSRTVNKAKVASVKNVDKGFKAYNACVTPTKFYNTGSSVTSSDRAPPKMRVTFAPVIEQEGFPTKTMDIRWLASKVHIDTHVVPTYRERPIPLRRVTIPVE